MTFPNIQVLLDVGTCNRRRVVRDKTTTCGTTGKSYQNGLDSKNRWPLSTLLGSERKLCYQEKIRATVKRMRNPKSTVRRFLDPKGLEGLGIRVRGCRRSPKMTPVKLVLFVHSKVQTGELYQRALEKFIFDFVRL